MPKEAYTIIEVLDRWYQSAENNTERNAIANDPKFLELSEKLVELRGYRA